MQYNGHATAQAVSRQLPTQRPRYKPRSGQVGFVVHKVALGQFSMSSSASLANIHSTDCSTLIIYHPGLVQ
jgi:hypothetical protein